jgi:hypothetical protein
LFSEHIGGGTLLFTNECTGVPLFLTLHPVKIRTKKIATLLKKIIKIPQTI